MNMRASTALVIVFTATFLQAAGTLGPRVQAEEISLPAAAPPYYRVRYAPSSVEGELVYGVSYTVWIPPGVEKLRGIIVHQHGCGTGACKAGQTAAFDLHWQALAERHHCALLGPSYEQPDKADCNLWCDPRHGSDKKYLQALDDLAQKTGHPELSEIPWGLWGHSGGATWVGTMLMLHPERIAAVWLRSGAPRLVPPEGSTLPKLEVSAAALAVPAMCNLGTQEGVTVKDGRFSRVWGNVETFFSSLRGDGALIGVSVDPSSSHDCGNQRYLAIPWFDACLAARLPEESGGQLKPMPTEPVWLAPLLGDKALPAGEFTGDVKQSVWLPDRHVATAWEQYVRDAGVTDNSPPPAPQSVQLRDNELSWDAKADLESGLAAFIIQRDGKKLARVPEESSSPFGRPIFQKNSYSDTPSQPLVEMKFVDSQAKEGESHEYRIIAVNTVGLESAPSDPATTP